MEHRALNHFGIPPPKTIPSKNEQNKNSLERVGRMPFKRLRKIFLLAHPKLNLVCAVTILPAIAQMTISPAIEVF